MVNGIKSARECSCHIRWTEEQKLKLRYECAGGKTQFYNYNFDRDYVKNPVRDDTYPFILKYIEHFPRSERVRASITYFHGTNGTQKTTVAYYILREIIKLGFKARYLLMNDLIKYLMKAERDEEMQHMIESLSDYDLLIIDEAFMKNKVTIYQSKFQMPFLDSFIRNRINKSKGIIFISNVAPEEISSEGFSKDIQDIIVRQVRIDKSSAYFTMPYVAGQKVIDEEGMFNAK